MSESKKHILVIRLSAMGDVAMTVPVLRALIQQNPELKITILTRAIFTPFFKDLPNVSVFPIDIKDRHKGFLGLYRLSKELKNLNIDAIADLHNVLRTNILKWFFFGKIFIQIDKGRAEKKALTNGTKVKQLKTTHVRYAEVFEALGFKPDLSNPTFPNKADLNNKTTLVVGKKETKWIGIAPFAAHNGKMYPLDLMETVIESLSKSFKVFLFGGGDREIKVLDQYEQRFKNVVNLAGKLTLEEELDVISNLDVMLSMDSGNAHIAAMLGVKTVTIWGVTHPFAGFAPFHQPKDYTLLANREQYPKIPTSVYGNKYPKGYEKAAGSVLPEMVIKKIKSII